ncbi:MAG: FKBP-type peptidyl-prolyl cis-trans isomerase [Actinomycetaceae bacterium]|nr:FKBP-type peptidyl-prolyl cis-trans isomerase [Actinomycetaceae bacterium]
MTITPLRKACALGATFTLTLALAACTPASTPGSGASGGAASDCPPAAGQSGAQSGLDTSVPIDRSGNGPFPEVKAGTEGASGASAAPVISKGEGQQYAEDKVLAKTLTKGDGPEVCAGDVVTVHYVGALWDGTVFDSSWPRGTTTTFSLDQVIPGWNHGLQGQRVGDRVELIIPAAYAYGEQGTPESPGSPGIPPNSTLVFVVDIQSAKRTNDLSILSQAKPTGQKVDNIEVTGDLGKEPTVALKGEVATEEKVVTLAEGTGEEISDTDSVVLHGVATVPGQEPNSTWAVGKPATVRASQLKLGGQKVGSRVLVVLPVPAQPQSALPEGAKIPNVQVYVVDIVAVIASTG